MRRLLVPFLLAAFLDDGPAVPPVRDDLEAKRAERIALSIAALETQAKATAAFGHGDEFAAALGAIHDDFEKQRLAGDPKRFEAGVQTFWPHQGLLWDMQIPMSSVETWLTWNRPAAGRTLPVALDRERDGDPFPAIVDFARQMNEHGVEFLLVVFPNRLQLYPELVLPELQKPRSDNDPPFAAMNAADTQFLLELSKAGVEVLDLSPAFTAERVLDSDERRRFLYHRYNMHWTPRAAELAARQIADRVATMPWFRPGPYKAGGSFDVVERKAGFKAEGNAEAPDAQKEPISINSVQMRGSLIPKASLQAGPIALLGDSFVIYHEAFNGALHHQLFRFTGWPIDVVAPPGGGELSCREALARQSGVAEKKVVIWVMQEAVLVPSGQWKKVQYFR